MSLAGPNRKPALTAAASKIGYSRQTAAKLKELPWQDRAWQVYEAEGSIYFMTRYRSAVARKVDYFVGTVDRPGDDPDIDIEYNDEGEVLSLGAATKVLEAEGGPELIRRLVSELMVHWDVPGEAYLVRFDVEPFWRILSTQELRKQGDTFTWGEGTYQQGSIDPDGVFRVWKPHPRFHWEPDSPTKHILEDAEELILLRRELKARSQSRLPSGAWILPDSVDFSPFGEDENGTADDFARELTDHMSMAVKDAGSAASLVPWILTVDRADHPLVVNGYVSFTRDWEVNLEQRDALLRSIATGLDVPPEILTGMADLNHWSAWLVSEQAVSQHVAPTVDDILDSLTVNWFRPLLEAAMVDPDGYVLWRDISPATVPPDRTGVALDLFRDGVISDTAVRRVSDFDEDDAPEAVEEGAPVMDAAELLQRINAFGTLRRAGAEWDDAVRAVGLPPIAQIPGLLPITVRAEEVVKNEEPVVAAIDDLLGGDPPLPGAAVTAAVRRRIVATELADLDAELLAWVVEEADQEIDRLLNLALTAADDPIDESMLVPLAQRLEAKIAQAQAAARGWLSRTLGRTPSDEGESLARSQGVQVILAGIVEAVRRKLFTPDARPDPIDLGRMPEITTPTEAIRNGLSLAGGGPAVYEDGNTSELIGNGQKVKEELAGDGFFVDGYEWKYGNPANTFEPHLRLDGVQFTSWEDSRLAVGIGDSWLRRSHYRPGDHRGCQCAFVQVIIEPAADIDERTGERIIAPTVGGEGNISIDGMNPQDAESFMATRRDLIARYPDAASRVTHWGTGEDALSKLALRENIVDDLAAARLAGARPELLAQLQRGLDELDAGGSFDDVFNRAFQTPGRLNGVNLRHADGRSTIVVRPSLDPLPDSNKVMETGFDSIRYTTTHEFGHAVEHDLLDRVGDKTPLPSTVTSTTPGTATMQDAIIRAGYNANVSKYGRSNPTEGFAELFVAYEAGLPAGERMATLLDLASQAEAWASWNARFPVRSLTAVEWITKLEQIGAQIPPYGTFTQ